MCRTQPQERMAGASKARSTRALDVLVVPCWLDEKEEAAALGQLRSSEREIWRGRSRCALFIEEIE